MDPIAAWKALTNTERAVVLATLKGRELASRDRAPWLRAFEALQAIQDTPFVVPNT